MLNHTGPRPRFCDRVFHALADAETPRHGGASRAGRPRSRSRRTMAMSLPRFMHTFRCLNKAAWCARKRRGRVRTCTIDPAVVARRRAGLTGRRYSGEFVRPARRDAGPRRRQIRKIAREAMRTAMQSDHLRLSTVRSTIDRFSDAAPPRVQAFAMRNPSRLVLGPASDGDQSSRAIFRVGGVENHATAIPERRPIPYSDGALSQIVPNERIDLCLRRAALGRLHVGSLGDGSKLGAAREAIGAQVHRASVYVRRPVRTSPAARARPGCSTDRRHMPATGSGLLTWKRSCAFDGS